MKNQTVYIDVFHNILWSKYKGGVFSSLHNLKKKEKVSFFQIAKTDGQRQGLAEVDLSYHRYPYELLFDRAYDAIPKYRLVVKLVHRILCSKADVVLLPGYHLVEYWAMLFACILTRKKRAVFVDSTRMDNPISKTKDFLKRVFFSQCHAFFCYGTRSREYLLSLGVPSEKIFFRCQAAALEHQYNSDNALDDRIERLSNSSVASFLYVGRLAPEKGLDVLLKAFQRLHRQNPMAKLTIVGSGPLVKELVTLTASLELQDAVTYVGACNIEQLPKFYQNASCLVLPSRSEPWGLVANEAMSYGCPVIVSDHCGCAPDIVIDGETGYVFKTDDIDDLTKKMHLVLSEHAGAVEYAKNCINMMKNFTPDRAAQQILNGCKSLFGIRELQ